MLSARWSLDRISKALPCVQTKLQSIEITVDALKRRSILDSVELSQQSSIRTWYSFQKVTAYLRYRCTFLTLSARRDGRRKPSDTELSPVGTCLISSSNPGRDRGRPSTEKCRHLWGNEEITSQIRASTMLLLAFISLPACFSLVKRIGHLGVVIVSTALARALERFDQPDASRTL